jgi:DNA-binding transcriptional LysR family regulator
MNLSKVDLNLFIVFDAIYTEANLTRAGQIVGITQPAVSNALARLRETFNDPLFVRTAQGMVPTPMAQNIIGPVRNALSLLRVSVQESRIFNPLQAVKTYRISMTDLTEAVILPPLFQRLRRPGADGDHRVSCPSAAKPPRNWPPGAWILPWMRRSTPTRKCATSS